MQCYPSYAMYWAVLAAANWATGQVNCQGQLGSNIAAYCHIATFQGSLGDTHTYIHILYISPETIYILYISPETIYKLYLRMCVCVSLSHSTDYEGPSLKHPLP